MGVIVIKKIEKYMLMLILILTTNYMFSQDDNEIEELDDYNNGIIEQFETHCHYGHDSIKNNHNYSIEDRDLSSGILGLEDLYDSDSPILDKFDLTFHSEVKDTFDIYINGTLYKENKYFDTYTTYNEETNRVEYPIDRSILLDFPDDSDEFVLRVESNLYGCFETKVKKEHPILYVKYYTENWYLDHTNVIYITGFLRVNYEYETSKGIHKVY